MKDDEKRCWTCLDEDRCSWPPECVCEKWKPELKFGQERKKKGKWKNAVTASIADMTGS